MDSLKQIQDPTSPGSGIMQENRPSWWVAKKHITTVPAIVTILVLIVLLVRMPERAIIGADTSSYLHYAAQRTAGYPLFLKLVGPEGAFWFQPIVFALAVGFLGFQAIRLTGSVLFSLVLMLGVANPAQLRYHYAILTESLFVSLCLVFIGLLMRVTVRAEWKTVSIAALTAGLATAVRPVGIFLLPTMIFLLLQLPTISMKHRLLMILSAVIPFFTVCALEQAVSLWAHGENTMIAKQLFAKAALLDAPTLDNAIPTLSPAGQAMARDFAPVRDLIAQAPNLDAKTFLIINYEVCIERHCSAAVAPSLSDQDKMQATRARIVANPFGYFVLTWRHYLSLWGITSGQHSTPGIEAFLKQHRPLPFEQLVPALSERPRVQSLAFIERTRGLTLAAVTACAALLGVICLWRGRIIPQVGLLATTLALGLHGGALLTAMAGVGIPRYFLILRPLLVATLICALWWILEECRSAGLMDWRYALRAADKNEGH
jgi:hypothetical protein